MKIGGYQKLTLLDYPGHTACTVFTVGCNMRCPFCYNVPLVTGSADECADMDELFGFLKKRAGLLEGVCVTGGEPTLQPDLYDFIMSVRSLGYAIKLDTNGTRPDTIERLIDGGLIDYVAMDIKSSRERYAQACGIPGFEIGQVERSAGLLMRGLVPYEFRTTVSKELHDVETMKSIGQWLSGAQSYYIQSYKDAEQLVGGKSMTPFSAEELRKLLEAVSEYIPSAKLRGVE